MVQQRVFGFDLLQTLQTTSDPSGWTSCHRKAACPPNVNAEEYLRYEENNVHTTQLAVELHCQRYFSYVCIVMREDSRIPEDRQHTSFVVLALFYAYEF